MATRNHQGQKGEALQWLVLNASLSQGMGKYVRLDVVYANEWNFKRLGDGLGGSVPHKQRAEQARTLGSSYGIKVFKCNTCLGECGFNGRNHRLAVGPRREFGDHAPVLFVH